VTPKLSRRFSTSASQFAGAFGNPIGYCTAGETGTIVSLAAELMF